MIASARELAPAPSSPPPRMHVAASSPAPAVLTAGALTTGLALAAVWAASAFFDENVMGLYADYILPVGAILVGLGASSGFGAASWWSGAKITGRLLIAVGLILFAGYWAAQVVEFRVLFPDGAFHGDGSEATFLEYYDSVTRSFAWTEHGRTGSALGGWGYLLRVGEIAGFCGGGLIAPIVLRSKPYCASCARYMRSPVVAVVPAGIVPKKVKKKDLAGKAAQEAEASAALEEGRAAVERIFATGASGDPVAFKALLAEVGPLATRRKTEKLAARVHVAVVHCRACGAGELRASLVTGQGQEIRSTALAARPLEHSVAPRLLRAVA